MKGGKAEARGDGLRLLGGGDTENVDEGLVGTLTPSPLKQIISHSSTCIFYHLPQADVATAEVHTSPLPRYR